MKRASGAELRPEGRAWPSPGPAAPAGTPRRALGLWLFVAAGFVLLAVVYGIALRLSRAAPIREVPVATQGGRP